MSYIAYPSANAPPERDGATEEYHPGYKRLIRTVMCGLLFAIPYCVAAPTSPLLRLSQTQDNKKTLIPRMMSDFFYVTFAASAASYWLLVEPFIPNPIAKEGFTPYLGPLTAQIPSLSSLLACHLYYPGMWAVFNEVTWKTRRREFVRLNTKCFFAYSPVHVPGAVGIGVFVGVFMYPFKYAKIRRQRKEQSDTPSA